MARLPSPKKPKKQPKLLFFLLLFSSLLLFPSISFSQDDVCSHLSFDKRQVVTHVYDGDTVKLANGEKIRLIGINTPEMNYDTGSPEPYAKKAKQLLEKHVLKKKIGIKYGKEKKDRHKRRLGHLFLLDGTNVQHEILNSGLAFHIAIPPNLWQHDCYKKTEQEAKKKHLRIWKSPYFKPINANRVNKSKLGFKQVSGKIESVLATKKTIWIKFSEKMAIAMLESLKNLSKVS